jgi:hypothetical protein
MKCVDNVDKYADALPPAGEKPNWKPDKIRVAKEVSKRWKSGLNYLDLYKRLSGTDTRSIQLAALIQQRIRHVYRLAPRA